MGRETEKEKDRGRKRQRKRERERERIRRTNRENKRLQQGKQHCFRR